MAAAALEGASAGVGVTAAEEMAGAALSVGVDGVAAADVVG